MLHAAVLEAFQHVQHLLYGEGRVRRVVVDPLEVAVGFLLHLLRESGGRLIRERSHVRCRAGGGGANSQELVTVDGAGANTGDRQYRG